MIIGMVKDKDITAVLAELPQEASYYFCQAKIPRALPAEQLQLTAASAGLHGKVIADVNDAIREALSTCAVNDFIFVGGSTFVVAEIENL